jgi:putative heme iron utilization protein
MKVRDITPDETKAEARGLLLAARHAALAMLGSDGAPFVTLVAIATADDGAPLFLLSALARHTHNLLADPRAAVLVAAASDHPMAAPRLTVSGTLLRAEDDALRGRFLSCHPEARAYAGFADFGLWRMAITGAHLVAGFGRIEDLDAAALRGPAEVADALVR